MTRALHYVSARARTLRSELTRAEPSGVSAREAVVLATGFIEQGYWYQIGKPGYHLAQDVAAMGYDAHVLSFLPRPHILRPSRLAPDASFRDIVTRLLPHFLSRLKRSYDAVHLVGHSYAAPLLMAYLAGYSSQKGVFRPSHARSVKAQAKVASLSSLAGMYAIPWSVIPFVLGPAYRLVQVLAGSGAQFGREALAHPLWRWLQRALPYLPTGKLESWVPQGTRLGMHTLASQLPQGALPFVHAENTEWSAFLTAVTHGSADESWESLASIFSLSDDPKICANWGSEALRGLSPALSGVRVPTMFVQGSRDPLTSPQLVRRFGYDALGAEEKVLHTMPGTGHQDLLTPLDPTPLRRVLGGWFGR